MHSFRPEPAKVSRLEIGLLVVLAGVCLYIFWSLLV